MRAIASIIVSVFLFVSVSHANFSAQIRGNKGQASQAFPLGPDPEMTPGKLCDSPSELRYPEKIAYCNRNVSTGLKKEIIADYDDQLGFSVQKMDRKSFKIDHFFPLCAGGSNDKENLWPQHSSVYAITDPLEPELCAKMAQGVLKQQEAIELVIRAKLDLKQAPAVIEYVRSL
jgi:hypothetical protein